MGRGATITLDCKEDIPAKVIIIQIATNTDQEILTLCEVEVYGSKLKSLLTVTSIFFSSLVTLVSVVIDSSIITRYIDAVSVPVRSSCSDGYEAHGDSCYLYETNPSTWEDAKLFCSNLGVSLVSINSGGQSAAAYVASHIYNSSFWIGLKKDRVRISNNLK